MSWYRRLPTEAGPIRHTNYTVLFHTSTMSRQEGFNLESGAQVVVALGLPSTNGGVYVRYALECGASRTDRSEVLIRMICRRLIRLCRSSGSYVVGDPRSWYRDSVPHRSMSPVLPATCFRVSAIRHNDSLLRCILTLLS